MAAVGVGKIGLKSRIFAPQLMRFIPIMPGRCITNKSAGSVQNSSSKAAKQESSKAQASYQVPEYYSHTKDTYADMEIEMASLRQSQPDPRVPYYHNYPWEKQASQ